MTILRDALAKANFDAAPSRLATEAFTCLRRASGDVDKAANFLIERIWPGTDLLRALLAVKRGVGRDELYSDVMAYIRERAADMTQTSSGKTPDGEAQVLRENHPNVGLAGSLPPAPTALAAGGTQHIDENHPIVGPAGSHPSGASIPRRTAAEMTAFAALFSGKLSDGRMIRNLPVTGGDRDLAKSSYDSMWHYFRKNRCVAPPGTLIKDVVTDEMMFKVDILAKEFARLTVSATPEDLRAFFERRWPQIETEIGNG